jgi:minor extracellular serine protease Vpr
MIGKVSLGLLVLLLCLVVVAKAQSSPNESKIDFPFRELIAQQKTADSLAKRKCRSLKKRKRGGKQSIDTLANKQYSCLIYTTDPSVLLKKGVLIQSTLPGFVTALATLAQMQAVAGLPQVSFIKAPDRLELHNN